MFNFKNLKMKPKLIAMFLLVGLVPLTIIGMIASNLASKSLMEKSYGQLKSVREIKKTQIEKYFQERQGDMGVLVETVGTLRNEAFEKLGAIEKIKKNQIQGYFNERVGDINVLSKSKDVTTMYDVLFKYHKDTDVKATGSYDVTTLEYNKLYDKNSDFLNNYVKTYGYYDMFIICTAHGHVMYTSAKELPLKCLIRSLSIS